MVETFSLAVWCAEPETRFDLRKFQNLRRDALHHVLEGIEDIRVLDWDKTDDRYEHEIVDLVIEIGGVVRGKAAVPALLSLRHELVKSGTSAEAVQAAITLIGRLAPKQAAGEIAVVHMHLLNNFVIVLYPAGQMAEKAVLRMIRPNGEMADIPYDAAKTETVRFTGKQA